MCTRCNKLKFIQQRYFVNDKPINNKLSAANMNKILQCQSFYEVIFGIRITAIF